MRNICPWHIWLSKELFVVAAHDLEMKFVVQLRRQGSSLSVLTAHQSSASSFVAFGLASSLAASMLKKSSNCSGEAMWSFSTD